MIIESHREHYMGFRTQYSRQDGDEDDEDDANVSQYREKVLFKFGHLVLCSHSYWKSTFLKEGVTFVDVRVLQQEFKCLHFMYNKASLTYQLHCFGAERIQTVSGKI